jgi:hypothetical protein
MIITFNARYVTIMNLSLFIFGARVAEKLNITFILSRGYSAMISSRIPKLNLLKKGLKKLKCFV